MRENPDQDLRDALGFSEDLGDCGKKVVELEADAREAKKAPPLELKTFQARTAPRSSWATRFGAALGSWASRF